MLATSYPFMDVMWSMLVFFAWVIWIWMIFAVLGSLYSSHDISGFGKVTWTVFVIIVPFIGVFTYLIVHGGRMAKDPYAAQAGYAGTASSGDDAAAQITKGKQLLDSGAITPTEFDALKRKALATA